MSIRLHYTSDPRWSRNPNPKPLACGASNTPNLLSRPTYRGLCDWVCGCLVGKTHPDLSWISRGWGLGGQIFCHHGFWNSVMKAILTCSCRENPGCGLGNIQPNGRDEKWQWNKSLQKQAVLTLSCEDEPRVRRSRTLYRLRDVHRQM